jgi:hypothetical protein
MTDRPLVTLTGGYVTLYVVAAVVCFVGSAFVGRMRSVEEGAQGD